MTGRYGAKVDVFSFDVLAWELLSRRCAYDDVAGRPEELIAQIAERGLRLRLPASWPPEIVQLLRTCWSADAAARPSAERVASELEAFIGLASADGGRRHAQLGMAGRRAVADERVLPRPPRPRWAAHCGRGARLASPPSTLWRAV